MGIQQDELAMHGYDACEDMKNPAGGSVGKSKSASSVARAAAGTVREPADPQKVGFVSTRCE